MITWATVVSMVAAYLVHTASFLTALVVFQLIFARRNARAWKRAVEQSDAMFRSLLTQQPKQDKRSVS